MISRWGRGWGQGVGTKAGRSEGQNKSGSSGTYYCSQVWVALVCYLFINLLWVSGLYGVVILIGQDGVQRPPIRFPTTGSLLSFLNCLENGLHPHGELDPPLFNPRSKGLALPRLKRPASGDNLPLMPFSKGENANQDYVFRLVSGTKPEDVGMCFQTYLVKLFCFNSYNCH